MDPYVGAMLQAGCLDGHPSLPKLRAWLSRALRCMRLEYVQHYANDNLVHRLFDNNKDRHRAYMLLTRTLMADFNTTLAYAGVLMTRTAQLRRTMQIKSYLMACVCISNQMLDDISEESTSCLYTAELPDTEAGSFGKAVATVFKGLNCCAHVRPEEIAKWTATYVRALV